MSKEANDLVQRVPINRVGIEGVLCSNPNISAQREAKFGEVSRSLIFG